MSVKKQRTVAPELVKAINSLLDMTLKDKEATLDQKLKVIDRSLKLEAIKLKMEEEQYGKGFFNEGE